jgi:7-carboxy-7-deazaguanine synthase
MFGTNEIVGRKYFVDAGDRLMVTSIFVTLQGEGPYAGLPAVFVRTSKCQLKCSFCFPDYYVVGTKRGRVKLRDVVSGDEVLTLDESLAPAWTTVKATNVRTVPLNDMRQITYRVNGTLRNLMCTVEHPFNVKDVGFVPARDLKPGMIVHHLPGYEKTGFLKTEQNPMKTRWARRQVSVKLREGHKTGKIESWKRDQKTRELHRERMLKHNPMHNPSSVKKMLQSKQYYPTALEKRCAKSLQLIGSGFEWVGNDLDYIIGSDDAGYRVPDFALPGTNKLIEVFAQDNSAYDRRSKHAVSQYAEKRREHFAKFGYDVLVLEGNEFTVHVGQGSGNSKLLSASAVEQLRKRINAFVTNGVEIVSVGPVPNKAHGPLSTGGALVGGGVKVVNLSCHPHNTFLMRGLHTHNCDTWFDTGDWFTVDELSQAIKNLIFTWFGDPVPAFATWAPDLPPRQMVLVVTGGEPMLQANLSCFLQALESQFQFTQIESNGLLLQPLPKSTTLVVSPKCREEKDGVAIEYLQPNIKSLARADCLKFVMSADQDSPYARVPEWALEWRQDHGTPIYVSPMNMYLRLPAAAAKLRQEKQQLTLDERSTTDERISIWEPGLLDMEAVRRNHEYTAQYAIMHGLRLSIQMQIFANLP